jgi:ribose transport system ATP-binding protein
MTMSDDSRPAHNERAGPAGPLVAFDRVTKRFGSTEALTAVSLVGHAGSVHAVTGENGAGKSTLMNLLAGVHRPDEGEMRLSGRRVELRSPSEARAAGISTIFQELTLLPNLTVAENMFLGREPRRSGLIDRTAMRKAARAALDRLGSHISENAWCGELSVGEQQLVEIAKGISADAQIFILDEPTAALNAPEVEKLAALIASMKAAGRLVFYISHRLDEIFRFCDTVSVLKDGYHVATAPVAELDRDRLVSLMVGRTLGQLYPPRTAARPGRPALSIAGLRMTAQSPAVTFTLARGEILGLAGLEGQGQRGIIRAMAGVEPPAAGEVIKHDADAGNGAPAGIAVRPAIVSVTNAGIGFAPEDRKAEGLYLPLSIAENMALGTMRGQSVWSRARLGLDQVRALIERMRVVATGPGQVVGSLSGGNQQKVMLGRWLASGVDVLLIEEPTRGVDVGAKAEIYGLLREFADAGGAVLITSSELTEVLGLCDRILVVREGALVAAFDGLGAGEEQIMRAALGGDAVVEIAA